MPVGTPLVLGLSKNPPRYSFQPFRAHRWPPAITSTYACQTNELRTAYFSPLTAIVESVAWPSGESVKATVARDPLRGNPRRTPCLAVRALGGEAHMRARGGAIAVSCASARAARNGLAGALPSPQSRPNLTRPVRNARLSAPAGRAVVFFPPASCRHLKGRS